MITGVREEDMRTSIHTFAFYFCMFSNVYKGYLHRKIYIFWGCILKLFKIDKLCGLRYLGVVFQCNIVQLKGKCGRLPVMTKQEGLQESKKNL